MRRRMFLSIVLVGSSLGLTLGWTMQASGSTYTYTASSRRTLTQDGWAVGLDGTGPIPTETLEYDRKKGTTVLHVRGGGLRRVDPDLAVPPIEFEIHLQVTPPKGHPINEPFNRLTLVGSELIVLLDIAPTRVALPSLRPFEAPLEVAMDTTDRVHRYRVRIDADKNATLFIDGVNEGTLYNYTAPGFFDQRLDLSTTDCSIRTLRYGTPVLPELDYRLPFVGGPFYITDAPDCPKHNPLGSVDYALMQWPVVSSEEGVVSFRGIDPGTCYGNQIVIDHPDGRRTRYAHLESFSVNLGDTVTRGQAIAISGNTTGTLSTCPTTPTFHLHFEVIDQAGAMEPWIIISLPGTTWTAGATATTLCQPGKNSIDGTATGP